MAAQRCTPPANYLRPAVLCTILLALLLACQQGADGAYVRRGLLQDLGAIPNECIETGLNLQGMCNDVIQSATTFFGLSSDASELAGAIDRDRLQAFINDPSNVPTPECCVAADEFNSASCSCSAAVLEMVKSFTGGDIGVYGQVAAALADACSFKLQFGSTCPT